MKELESYKINCDFCGKKINFLKIKQVVLRVDKNNNFQNLFGNICETCDESGIKKTLHGQSLKIITNRNKFKDEQSIFETDKNLE